MILNRRFIFIFLSVFLMAGCASNKEMYYWGDYEQMIHDAYVEPGSADAQTQVEKLNVDIQKSEAMGKRVAPGIYAHLGFLYASQGKDSQSKSAFMEERALYPESANFIDGMMNRAMMNEGDQE